MIEVIHNTARISLLVKVFGGKIVSDNFRIFLAISVLKIIIVCFEPQYQRQRILRFRIQYTERLNLKIGEPRNLQGSSLSK